MRNATAAGPLRTSLRLAWYRLTKRMPRYKGRPEPDRRLSVSEVMDFANLMITYRQGAGSETAERRERRRSS